MGFTSCDNSQEEWRCVDMRMANKTIRRERHPTPTVDDLIHTLNGATVFSKLDLRAGYHQIPLKEESQYITTFVTHKGLRRYARLNFGTNSASDIIGEQIRDIPGSLNISSGGSRGGSTGLVRAPLFYKLKLTNKD